MAKSKLAKLNAKFSGGGKSKEETSTTNNGLVIFKKGKYYGLRTKDGEQILAPEYSYIDDVVTPNAMIMVKDKKGDKRLVEAFIDSDDEYKKGGAAGGKKGFIVVQVLGMGSYQPIFSDDDGLMFFPTAAAANAEIQETIDDVADAIKKGDMDEDSALTTDDYIVVPAKLNGTEITCTVDGDNYKMERTDDDWERFNVGGKPAGSTGLFAKGGAVNGALIGDEVHTVVSADKKTHYGVFKYGEKEFILGVRKTGWPTKFTPKVYKTKEGAIKACDKKLGYYADGGKPVGSTGLFSKGGQPIGSTGLFGSGGYTADDGPYQINVHGEAGKDFKIVCKHVTIDGKKVQVCYHETNDGERKGVEVYSGENYIVGSKDKSYSRVYQLNKVPAKYLSAVAELKTEHARRKGLKKVEAGGKPIGSTFADGGNSSNLKVETNKDLEDTAAYMAKAVKKRSDLKDLIFYFEKDNGFDYKVRVKVWDEMNMYEAKKDYKTILELLKKIVEGNGKKLTGEYSEGGKPIGSTFDAGGWVGVDANLAESLHEYGFVMQSQAGQKNMAGDEYAVVYKISDGVYSHSYTTVGMLDEIVNGESWANEKDIKSFLGTVGSTKEEWLKSSPQNKLSDLLSYWGYDNVLGVSYDHITKKEADEFVGIDDDDFAKGGTVSDDRVDTVLRHYVAAALWSTTDRPEEGEEDSDENLDRNYDYDDLDPKLLENMRKDIKKFLTENEADLAASELSDEQIGHTFWLARHHHGAGWFDFTMDADVEERITKATHAFKETDLYAQDGKVYADGYYEDGGRPMGSTGLFAKGGIAKSSFSTIEREVPGDVDYPKQKVIIGVTKGGSLIVLEIDNGIRHGNRDPYFSMSGTEMIPYTLAGAKKYAKQYWVDFFEQEPEQMTDMNERMGTKFRSAKAAAQYVLDTDGELHGFDSYSGFGHDIVIDGKEYLFLHQGGGQNRDTLDDLSVKYVSDELLNRLKMLWDAHHLKVAPSDVEIPVIKQDRDAILKDAITVINKRKFADGGSVNDATDYDFEDWSKYDDRHAAHEIELYAENNEPLYRQRWVPIMKNLKKKLDKGTFDVKKAAVLMKYFVEDADKKYAKEFGNGTGAGFILSVKDRKLLSERLAEGVLLEYQANKLEGFAAGGTVGEDLFDKCIEAGKTILEDAIDDAKDFDENNGSRGGDVVETSSMAEGGYETKWFTNPHYFISTGKSLQTHGLIKVLARKDEMAHKAAVDWFKDTYPAIVKQLGDDFTYHTIEEEGYTTEAEEFDEQYRGWFDDETIMNELGFHLYKADSSRAINNKITCEVFASVNMDSPYHRQRVNEASTHEKFNFSTVEGFKKKFAVAVAKVVEWITSSSQEDNKDDDVASFRNGGVMFADLPEFARGGPVKIPNSEAKEKVLNRTPFRGSNLEGKELSNGSYVVLSYGHYPIWYWSAKDKKWFVNTSKYSSSTSAHVNQSRPLYDNVESLTHTELTAKMGEDDSHFDLGGAMIVTQNPMTIDNTLGAHSGSAIGAVADSAI